MSTPIIVMGAHGRMGATIAQLIRNDEAAELAAVCERAGRGEGLELLGCEVGEELGAVLKNHPGAVVIDFTAVQASLSNARVCAEHGNPIVIGTTGFTPAELDELRSIAEKNPTFWAPNMSVGVNVLQQVLPELVKKLGPDYDLEMVELHHNKKKDAPSGTALKLAECLAEARDWDLQEVGNFSREGIIGERPKEEIGVQTIRGGDVVGVHTVYFMGPGERIEVTHHAHSRDTFAQGSIRAAKWLAGQKPGKLYAMADVFA
ncbi:4-hydroxy-tetrahydrodipicolinate reductase [Desulfobaculum bizertense]|uniref:4-hydroxy-tetrahydrodipicolinate reductase n=1 Tax=Desulfobaculum bizertense DSM 18034 TaxID=1121442 RepID=A0A1T4WXY4_9BACT|nr:4-hydroxy-tetrahydrodipicolinate reductase [Desulfobaculum bizertense]SKA81471.1 dihydrodipicolinate reductase [Desulfobaculum bizertense DSM 18034]